MLSNYLFGCTNIIELTLRTFMCDSSADISDDYLVFLFNYFSTLQNVVSSILCFLLGSLMSMYVFVLHIFVVVTGYNLKTSGPQGLKCAL